MKCLGQELLDVKASHGNPEEPRPGKEKLVAILRLHPLRITVTDTSNLQLAYTL